MPHPNEELLRKLYDAFNQNDFDAVTKFMAPDVVGHLPGKSKLAGDYKGTEQVMGVFGKFAELEEDASLSLEVHDVLANDEHGVVLGKIKADKNGENYESNSIEIYHLKGGKITEFWTLEVDQYKADAFYG